jgi:hypothetical protein
LLGNKYLSFQSTEEGLRSEACSQEGASEALTLKLSAALPLARHFPISPQREENAAKCHEDGQANRNIPKHLRTSQEFPRRELLTTVPVPCHAYLAEEGPNSEGRSMRANGRSTECYRSRKRFSSLSIGVGN